MNMSQLQTPTYSLLMPFSSALRQKTEINTTCSPPWQPSLTFLSHHSVSNFISVIMNLHFLVYTMMLPTTEWGQLHFLPSWIYSLFFFLVSLVNSLQISTYLSVLQGKISPNSLHYGLIKSSTFSIVVQFMVEFLCSFNINFSIFPLVYP